MPLAQILAEFKANVAQCDSLIATAHKTDASGVSLFLIPEQQTVTVAAFLNLFIAWETFLEQSLGELMIGNLTISGSAPVRYVSPRTEKAARDIIKHVRPFFDYGNHGYVMTLVNQYFENGYPYEPHLSGVVQDLADLRTMRNASAHITSTTRLALENLALRVLQISSIGINLYTFLMATDPNSANGDTVYATYRDKLLVTADLVANG